MTHVKLVTQKVKTVLVLLEISYLIFSTEWIYTL